MGSLATKDFGPVGEGDFSADARAALAASFAVAEVVAAASPELRRALDRALVHQLDRAEGDLATRRTLTQMRATLCALDDPDLVTVLETAILRAAAIDREIHGKLVLPRDCARGG